MSKGLFSKNQKAFKIQLLTQEDVDKSLTLQQEVYDELKKQGQELFIVPKSKEELIKYTDGIHAVTLGLFAEDEFGNNVLAGQAVLHLKHSLHEPHDETKLSFFGKGCEFGGLLVSQEFRGHGIGQILLKEAEKLAPKYGIDYITAEVDISNPYSFGMFLKNGFVIGNADICLDDGAELYYLFKATKTPVKQISSEVMAEFKPIEDCAFESAKTQISQGKIFSKYSIDGTFITQKSILKVATEKCDTDKCIQANTWVQKLKAEKKSIDTGMFCSMPY